MAIGDEEYHRQKMYEKHSAAIWAFLKYMDNTRLMYCSNRDCEFNSNYKGEFGCDLRETAIDENGQCLYMKPKEPMNKKGVDHKREDR